jgi:hypothetical protein
MENQREHPRYIAKIKVEFENCGDESSRAGGEFPPSCAGFGHTLDVSLGGVLMTCSSETMPDEPVSLCFYISGKDSGADNIRFLTRGKVVRTGLVRDIPAEIKQKLPGDLLGETHFMAVKFANPLFELSSLLSGME